MRNFQLFQFSPMFKLLDCAESLGSPFRQQNVNSDKISFHLIGRTIWFNTEIKFSYFEPPLLFCDGDSKNKNLNSLQKYRVQPIK